MEIEAKLLVPQAGLLREIAKLRRIDGYELRRRDTARLHSSYLDTDDFRLARRGIALRLRRRRGKWEATAKWGGGRSGAVHERVEVTVPLRGKPALPFRLPSRGRLREALGPAVGDALLRTVLITEIQRTELDVLGAEAGTPVAELALDRVELRAPRTGARDASGRQRADYAELEIELKRGGARRDLDRLTRFFRERFGLAPSRESKFTRGLALLYPQLRRRG